MEQAKFTYSPLGKAFEKQIKIIEDQGEKQKKALEEHGKQLVDPNEIVKRIYHLIIKKYSRILLKKEWMELENYMKELILKI